MPKISLIKVQKNGKRVNIYLDGKFGFGLDLQNYLKYGLKLNQILEEEKIAEIIKKAEFQLKWDRLLRFATLRPRSESEVWGWMRKKRVHKSLENELFNKLKHLELVDDRKFAEWWIEQRLSFKPKSKRVLKVELRNKGINKEIIDDVLSEIKIDEIKIARGLIEKKKYKWDKLPNIEQKRKKSEFLLRNGFSWEVIRNILKDVDLQEE